MTGAWSRAQVAQHLGKSVKTISRWTQAGKFPHARMVGDRWGYDPLDVAQLCPCVSCRQLVESAPDPGSKPGVRDEVVGDLLQRLLRSRNSRMR